ncbi:DUF29 domain-containing protein [Chroococcus sp. FPU101]|uniref:DUF29 domain-containing protein n=1 Tax=Chroococcus sp. FPU101 TaxID=1974212 RepID=UPI001A8F98B7|nr:DUF29 domain-containing protein [Chroococcus sp. FPU101]GFE69769.1 protein of unknown function DUF29 [Chroococcus sp. FPU101]
MTLIALKTLYEQDYNLWLKTTVHLLRENKLDQIDYDNLIEELEGMGRSDKRALKSNLEQLLMHLLKWQYQSNKRTGSWERFIKEHRNRVLDTLEDSPSIKPYLNEIFNKCYQNARDYAVSETGLSLATFPNICPFTIQQILDTGFFW